MDFPNRTDPLACVSCIVAVRDEATMLLGLLDALAAQTYPRDAIEILIADGDSNEDTATRVRQWSAAHALPLQVLHNPARLTPAGFNVGLRHASGEVIIILGARARPVPDFIENSVAALHRSGADAVGGVVRTVAERDTAIARAIGLAQRSPFGVGDARYRYATEAGAADTVNYGAYRREVFERLGGFDEGLQWVEDDEFNYRLRAAGGRLWLDPAIRVTYLARPTLAGLWRQRLRWGRGKVLVARRHPGQMRPRHAIPALFVGALVGTGALALAGGRWRWPLAGLVGSYAVAASVAKHRILPPPNLTPRPPSLAGKGVPSLGVGGPLPVSAVADDWLCVESRPGTPFPAREGGRGVRFAFLTMHLAYGLGTWLGVLDLLTHHVSTRPRIPSVMMPRIRPTETQAGVPAPVPP